MQDKRIFVSTGAFSENKLIDILNPHSTNNIGDIELSSGIEYGEQDLILLKNALDSGKYRFLLHNYFPTPKDPFVLNLASNNEAILSRSREHCLTAIQLSAKLGAPFYSVHCGFCFHAGPAHLGMDQTKLERFSKNIGYDIFVKSLQLLSDAAEQHGIEILIENNVLAPFNLIDGRNELLLGVTSCDLRRILQSVSRENVGLLLDVGHLKVSAKTMRFSAELFIKSLGDEIRAVHLSDNDGNSDSNQQISKESWFWEPLKKAVGKETIWVLEVNDLSLNSIGSQLTLVHNKLEELF